MHWLDAEMIGKSRSFVEDEIAIRLDTYERSLRKHGIRTLLGSLSAVVDVKTVSASTAALATFTFAGSTLAGAIAAGSILVGKTIVHIGHASLDLIEVRTGPGSEIAYVAEVVKAAK